jgi:hypothetical protein
MDPHHFGKLDLHLHLSEKLNPNAQQNQIQEL